MVGISQCPLQDLSPLEEPTEKGVNANFNQTFGYKELVSIDELSWQDSKYYTCKQIYYHRPVSINASKLQWCPSPSYPMVTALAVTCKFTCKTFSLICFQPALMMRDHRKAYWSGIERGRSSDCSHIQGIKTQAPKSFRHQHVQIPNIRMKL